MRTVITYSGKQQLRITKNGKTIRFSARVAYDRIGEGEKTAATASFVSVLGSSGEQRDEINRDPDYLTILNQPFSIKLDPPTLRDLSHLRGRVPFDFPSPMTGAPLHGFLRRGIDAPIGGATALGVIFTAVGKMHGPLPDHPQMALHGTIHMTGTAFYQTKTALLMALDATVQISGIISNKMRSAPVTIVYKRTIRADRVSSTQQAVTPRP